LQTFARFALELARFAVAFGAPAALALVLFLIIGA
jgi:hypothetical protein